MTFQVFKLSNVIKQDVYVLRTKYRRRFSCMSQSSDELIIQIMVIARNKRLAVRFIAMRTTTKTSLLLSERSAYQ